MRWQGTWLAYALVLAGAACGGVDLPGDGAIACSPAADCPRGMTCASDGFCYRTPPTSDAGDDDAVDGHPGPDELDLLLALAFEGSAASETGLEPAVEFELMYAEGHTGDGLDMQSPSQLEYPASALFAIEGTIELWIFPSWTDDGLNHHLVTWGYNHGLLLFRDANQYLRLIVNRFGTAGLPPEERGVSYDVAALSPGRWHHVAATWTAGAFDLYLDGGQVGHTTDVTPMAPPASNVAIGFEAGTNHADAVLDDLRTWSVALGPDQIGARHAAGRGRGRGD